jgi:uracil-DNA glycosylase
MKNICSRNCPDVEFVCHMQKKSGYDAGIRMVMISESMPHDMNDYFDSAGNPQFVVNTNRLFRELGYSFESYEDYLKKGIYLTTALKCGKKSYLVKSETIKNCSHLLEIELERFENLKAIMLMGDFAIKSVNYIWKRKYGSAVIPAGSTYKIRKNKYEHGGTRFFPSYTQTGDSFGLEKSKLKMMEEDVSEALKITGIQK